MCVVAARLSSGAASTFLPIDPEGRGEFVCTWRRGVGRRSRGIDEGMFGRHGGGGERSALRYQRSVYCCRRRRVIEDIGAVARRR